jgi:hypothetical protein
MGTDAWFLEHKVFQQWKAMSGKILWCPGMRKSTLIFTLSELITRTADAGKTVLAYVAPLNIGII